MIHNSGLTTMYVPNFYLTYPIKEYPLSNLNQTIFITGANGFIGTSLVKCAEDRGFEVIQGVRCIESVRNKGKKYIEMDLSISDLKIDLENVDIVVHAAGVAHQSYSADKEAHYTSINVEGTKKLIQSCKKARVKRFIFISSVKVFGERTKGSPLVLTGDEFPEDVYGKSKLEAEKAVSTLCPEFGIEYVIIRPPLVYGPGVKANFLKLIKLTRYPIPLPFKTISEKRSYVYIENLTDAIMQASQHPKAPGNTYYIADDHPLSINYMITLLGQAMGTKPLLFPLPRKVVNIVFRFFGLAQQLNKIAKPLEISNRNAELTMNWTPKFSTKEGINKTIEWYKKSFT